MLINEKSIKSNTIKMTFATIALAVIAIILAVFFRPDSIGRNVVFVVELCAATSLILAIGLSLNEDTRVVGILYSTFIVILTLLSMIVGWFRGVPVTMDIWLLAFPLGCAFGIILAYLFLRKGRWDRLMSSFNLFVVILLAVLTGILLIYGVLSKIIALLEVGFSSNVYNDVVYVVVPIALVVGFWVGYYHLFLKKELGLSGSDVFVIGPASSGKTILGMSLCHYFTQEYHASTPNTLYLDSNITKPEELADRVIEHNFNTMWTNFARITIHTGDEEKAGAELIDATDKTWLAVNQFSLKFMHFIPISWTIADYAGEFYNTFTDLQYEESLKYICHKLSEKLSENVINNVKNEHTHNNDEPIVLNASKFIEKYYFNKENISDRNIKLKWDIEEFKLIEKYYFKHRNISSNASNPKSKVVFVNMLIEIISTYYPSLYMDAKFSKQLIRFILYNYYYLPAGKIMFIIDGETFVNEVLPRSISINEDEKKEKREKKVSIEGALDTYKKIFDDLIKRGQDKKVAFIVTKIDYIWNNSPEFRNHIYKKYKIDVENLDNIYNLGNLQTLPCINQTIDEFIKDKLTLCFSSFSQWINDADNWKYHAYLMSVSPNRFATSSDTLHSFSNDGVRENWGFDDLAFFGGYESGLLKRWKNKLSDKHEMKKISKKTNKAGVEKS